jgi:hypothetical protein
MAASANVNSARAIKAAQSQERDRPCYFRIARFGPSSANSKIFAESVEVSRRHGVEIKWLRRTATDFDRESGRK